MLAPRGHPVSYPRHQQCLGRQLTSRRICCEVKRCLSGSPATGALVARTTLAQMWTLCWHWPCRLKRRGKGRTATRVGVSTDHGAASRLWTVAGRPRHAQPLVGPHQCSALLGTPAARTCSLGGLAPYWLATTTCAVAPCTREAGPTYWQRPQTALICSRAGLLKSGAPRPTLLDSA